MLSRHYETSGFVSAEPMRVFAQLDDHVRLSAHMSKSSWKMGGGKMAIELDGGAGRSVGSRIRVAGRVFGVALSVEEKVTEREPPHRKTWETIGVPKLLVIAQYRLGFDVTPERDGSLVRVFIDYSLPEVGFVRWLGALFGDYYARWCTHQMLREAVAHFAPPAGATAPGLARH